MSRWSPVPALLALLTLAPLLAAQEPAPQALKPELRLGSELLRFLLNEQKIAPINTNHELPENPAGCLIVSLGDPTWLRDRGDFLRDWVHRGGGLLLATDHALATPDWRAGLVDVTNARPVTPLVVCNDPDRTYEGAPELPLLEPIEGAKLALPERVAASLPARLARIRDVPLPGSVKPFAALPPRSVLLGGDEELAPGDRVVGVAGSVGRGKVVLLADAHLFMNDLMARGDLGNFEFASAVVAYLHDGTPPRTRCLFVEDGVVSTRFDVPVKNLGELPWEVVRRAVRIAEAKLAQMEQDGKLHDLFWEGLRRANIGPARLAALAAAVLTLLGCLYLLYRLIRARVPVESGLPRLATSLEKQVPTMRLVPQRLAEQVDHGRLYEPARHLAREMFLAAGCPPGPRPPRVRIVGGWWQRWVVGARLRRLWGLAFGSRPVPVRARQWPALVRDVQSLRQAFLDGSILLESVAA